MKALLWKDFRINLPIVVAAALVWFIIHAVVVVIMFIVSRREIASVSHWSETLMSTNLSSLSFSQLLIGALGANAIASERTDRSAEFLFALPPTRGRILASKLIVALAFAVGLWFWHLAMLEVVVPMLGNFHLAGVFSQAERYGDIYPMTFAAGICLFGGSWLGSSLMKSAAFSLLVGIALTGAAVGVILNVQWLLKLPDSSGLDHAYQVTFLAMGITALGAGSIYFLRRVEP